MNGKAMKEWIARLQPICRSITGDGVRETLSLIGEQIPLERHEVASGTEVLDWTVPLEWNIRDAWIKDSSGRRVIELANSNLHVVSYSIPVAPRWISRDELEPHLHSLPEQPDWIPYRTAYYDPAWGFCLTQRQRDARSSTLATRSASTRLWHPARSATASFGSRARAKKRS